MMKHMEKRDGFRRIAAAGMTLALGAGMFMTPALAAEGAEGADEPEIGLLAEATVVAPAIQGIQANPDDTSAPKLLATEYDPSKANQLLESYRFHPEDARTEYDLYVLDGKTELLLSAFGDGSITVAEVGEAGKLEFNDSQGKPLTGGKLTLADGVLFDSVKVAFKSGANDDAAITLTPTAEDGTTEGKAYTIHLKRADTATLPQIDVSLDGARNTVGQGHVTVENTVFTNMVFSIKLDSTNGVVTGFTDQKGAAPLDYKTENIEYADVLQNKVLISGKVSLSAPTSGEATKVTAGKVKDGWVPYTIGTATGDDAQVIFSCSEAVNLTQVLYLPAADGKGGTLAVSVEAPLPTGEISKNNVIDTRADAAELFRFFYGLGKDGADKAYDSDTIVVGTDISMGAKASHNSIIDLYYGVFQDATVTDHNLMDVKVVDLTQITMAMDLNKNLQSRKPVYSIMQLDDTGKVAASVVQDQPITARTTTDKLAKGTYVIDITADGCLHRTVKVVAAPEKATAGRVDGIIDLLLGKVETASGATAAKPQQIALEDRAELLKYLNVTMPGAEPTEEADKKIYQAMVLCDLDGVKDGVTGIDLGILLENLGNISKTTIVDDKYTNFDYVVDLSK